MTTWKKRLAPAVVCALLFVALVASTASAMVPLFATQNAHSGAIPKYVFLFIGDGMSFPQIASAEMYLGKKANLTDLVGGGGIEQLAFTQLPIAGAAMTLDATSFIPDSASTATSIASGYKTLSGVLNMDISKTIKYTPISETLKAQGYKVGIVSSVPLNHATPAAFYAKVDSRSKNYEISLQAAASGFDYFAGGYFMDPQDKGATKTHVYDVFKKAGYKVANSKADILNLNKSSGKVLAVSPNLAVDGQSLPYEIDRKPGELSLADFVKKGIDVLDNDKGFFMMVEGGKIDWAAHANDGASSIHDTIALDNAVQEALWFASAHPTETLIVVTGDHECGGMSIGYAGTGYDTAFNKLDKVSMSFEAFDATVAAPYVASHTSETAKLSDLAQNIKQAFGLLMPSDVDAKHYPEMVLTTGEIVKLEAALAKQMLPASQRNYTADEQIMYGTYQPLSVTLTHLLNNKAGLTFSSYSHTALPVPVYAYGPGQELFNGYYDNTNIYHKLADILNLK